MKVKYSYFQKSIEKSYNLFKFGIVEKKITKDNIFHIINPDHRLSPITGMSRQHWFDAAEYLLNGAFLYIYDNNSPMLFPKQVGKTQPARIWKKSSNIYLEGLCRTLFIAVPVLKNNPKIILNKISVVDYYLNQFKLLVRENSKTFIPEREVNQGPSQPLVEFGGLAISFTLLTEILWDPLENNIKNKLASLMLSYAHGPTVNNNWRFFNIFILSFFKSKNYKINDTYLQELLNETIHNYVGNGWYHDNPAFDYYSMWGFQTYSQIWSTYYSYINPEASKKFEKNFQDIINQYPFMFDAKGKMIMWGRSVAYRTACATPLAFTSNLSNVNHGWMRRIASGVLLQFLQHPKLIKDGIPNLGFYDSFEPSVQSYNCRGSVYWMGKIFFALMFSEDSKFWNSIENNGVWNSNLNTHFSNNFCENTNILVTNYFEIGASEIRSIVNHKNNSSNNIYLTNENYNRLSYNSLFPWQADSTNGTVAMNYVILNEMNQWEAIYQFDNVRFEDNCYMRTAHLASCPDIKLNLSEKILFNGFLREDEILTYKDLKIRLGHYALPIFDKPIVVDEVSQNNSKAITINNGYYLLKLEIIEGWKDLEVRFSKNLHPESSKSAVINVYANIKKGETKLSCKMSWAQVN